MQGYRAKRGSSTRGETGAAGEVRTALAAHLCASGDNEVPARLEALVRAVVLDELVGRGIVARPDDDRAITRAVGAMVKIVRMFSDAPWTTHEGVLRATGLSLPTVLSLNALVRESPLLQSAIVADGPGHKYWQTILPLARSGALEAASAGRYRWPSRIGIYPGVSCMFYCSFCGRNPAAAYTGDTIAIGSRLFTTMFASANERDASFSLSGGLEPLTNPRIGALAAAAADCGIRAPLITNGFMLTPQYVARQEGLGRLSRLRVSLYGVDELSYVEVTGKRGAYMRVKSNLVDFLRWRNARGMHVKVGLNFIVLPGTTTQLEQLPRVIAEIDADVDGPGIDFLTLREDFGVPAERGLPRVERESLALTLERVRAEIADRRPDLDVDLGYALWAITRGAADRPLAMVTAEVMRSGAYPQVSVVVDLLGDVYLYREAGFLERPGATRYRIGRVTDGHGLEAVIGEWLEKRGAVTPAPEDPAFMDAFDHVVTLVLNRMDADAKLGVSLTAGPVRLA
jgi:dTDP-4-amino-4,6-dideoxy-D-glucose ammonia-lyase